MISCTFRRASSRRRAHLPSRPSLPTRARPLFEWKRAWAWAWTRVALIALTAGCYGACLAAVAQAQSTAEASAAVNRGRALLRGGQLKEAEAAFKEAAQQ